MEQQAVLFEDRSSARLADPALGMVIDAMESEKAAREQFIKWLGVIVESADFSQDDLLIALGVGPDHPWTPLVRGSSDASIRQQIHDFAVSETANPWHRKCLTGLFDDWHQWNDFYFDSALEVPLILLTQPSTPTRLGDCGPVSAFGGAMQIRIRPSLLRGTHPMFDRHNYANVSREGRFEFVRDVLLHEMIHQWQFTTGRDEPSYSGHGPHFRDKCNDIGDELGLPHVRTCKKRGRDTDLPSCSHWPQNVRRSGYYAGGR